MRYQVHGEVTVVNILTTELRDEDQIAPIRHELMTLMDQPVPKNVVLRMDRVTFLASSAIGMLLAHHQRLSRIGGGLRFALVRSEVRPCWKPSASRCSSRSSTPSRRPSRNPGPSPTAASDCFPCSGGRPGRSG